MATLSGDLGDLLGLPLTFPNGNGPRAYLTPALGYATEGSQLRVGSVEQSLSLQVGNIDVISIDHAKQPFRGRRHSGSAEQLRDPASERAASDDGHAGAGEGVLAGVTDAGKEAMSGMS